MAHDHHHEEDDLYYLGQLGLVFFSALYAAFALALSFHWTDVLNKLLGKQLQPYLLWSGVVLMVFAVVRGCVLWSAVGQSNEENVHEHKHDDQAFTGHDDTIVQNPDESTSAIDDDDATISESSPVNPGAHLATHDHDHDHEHHHDCDHHHEHTHSHAEDHEHDDHDHGWAPLRYLVLALGIGLFFLLYFWGMLPFLGPQVRAKDLEGLKVIGGQTTEAWRAASVIAMKPSFAQLGTTNALFNEPVEVVEFTTILKAIETAYARKLWKGKKVQVWGQFGSSPKAENFSLVRFRMQCCGADAIPIPIPVISNEPVYGYRNNDWIKVTGKVYFAKFEGKTVSMLQISGPMAILRAGPDPDPYIQ